jgi:hypothetical protein
MNTQRIIAVCMLLIQLCLFAVIYQSYLYIAAMAVLVLFGFYGKVTVVIDNSRQIIYGGILGLAFLLKWQFYPPQSNHVHAFLMNLGMPLTQYFFTLQVLTFYIRRYKRMPSIYPMFGVGSLVCLGDLSPTPVQMMVYQATIVLFIALTAIYFNAARNKRYPKSVHTKRLLAPSLVLIVALGLSSISSSLLYKYRRELDDLYTKFAYANIGDVQGVSLKSTVTLGDVASTKVDGGKAVALRIYSDKTPGYMRGRVFDEYANRRWNSTIRKKKTEPLAGLDGRGKNRFAVRGLANPKGGEHSDKSIEIWPASSLFGVGFNQLYTSHIDIQANGIRSSDFGYIYGAEIKGGMPYTLHYNFDPDLPAPSEADKAKALRVTKNLEVALAGLAENLFEGAGTPLQKAARVTAYFQENYNYQLGLDVPANQEPLVWFLTEQPAAHCEYFASGAAILLRLGGVPTRYVTGYVAADKNTVGGYHVARSRDAHAWVEAWIDDEWMLIEATPAQGIPQPEPIKESTQYWEDLKHRLSKIKHAFLSGLWMESLQELAVGVRVFFMAITTNKYTYILIVVVSLIAFVGFRVRKISHTAPPNLYERFHRLRHELDAVVEQKGMTRNASETLHQFAKRIDTSAENSLFLKQAASWYRQYAALRYLPNGKNQNSLDAMPPIPKET